MVKAFTPNFKTPEADQCSNELVKKNNQGYVGDIREAFRDSSREDIVIETEQLAKSHGIYLEFNRALTGKEKDWRYLIRFSNPGGGPLNREQWLVMDELSDKYTQNPEGHASLRLTTRQNIQFHWVKKSNLVEIVKRIAESGLLSLNGCGDNTRNVMSCPCSTHKGDFNGTAWAHKTGGYFQLPLEPFIKIFEIDPTLIRKPEESFAYGPQLLNRKFKFAFSSFYRDSASNKLIADNCVELRTNDVGIAPLIEQGTWKNRFQIYVGGGQGERNGKLSAALLAEPFGIVHEANLLATLDAILKVHQQWGDRQNRHWARVKYVIKKMGIPWYRDRVHEIVDFTIEPPQADYDYGSRHLHYGWHKQSTPDNWMFGAYIENGRISDAGPNGKLKTMVRHLISHYPIQLMVTPNQDLMFLNIPEASKADFETDLNSFGYGKRNGKEYSQLRLRSGACVGRDTCRLTYTDSEKFEPELLDELDQRGWGNMCESIGITGCERQCFRPSTKTIGIIGTGLNRYQIRLMGTEDARHQGQPIIDENGEMYLRTVARDQVAIVIDVLFKYYQAHKQEGESLGGFHRRIGMPALIEHLKNNPATKELMIKMVKAETIV